jgi:hypothetical protein
MKIGSLAAIITGLLLLITIVVVPCYVMPFFRYRITGKVAREDKGMLVSMRNDVYALTRKRAKAKFLKDNKDIKFSEIIINKLPYNYKEKLLKEEPPFKDKLLVGFKCPHCTKEIELLWKDNGAINITKYHTKTSEVKGE